MERSCIFTKDRSGEGHCLDNPLGFEKDLGKEWYKNNNPVRDK